MMKRVLVKWEDASSYARWESKEESLKGSIAECETVGWIMKKNKREVIVASTRSDIPHYADKNVFPRRCIKSIEEI